MKTVIVRAFVFKAVVKTVVNAVVMSMTVVKDIVSVNKAAC